MSTASRTRAGTGRRPAAGRRSGASRDSSERTPRGARTGSPGARPAAPSTGLSSGLSGGPSTGLSTALARARRRRVRARLIGAAVFLVLLAGAVGGGWYAWDSGAVDVHAVSVVGATRTGDDAVRDAVGDIVGTPMPLVDTQLVAERVAGLPLVVGVSVSRRWPDTVVVRVTERQPLAAVPSGDGLVVVDREGVTLEQVPGPGAQAPDGLPVVAVDLAAGAGPLVAAATVARGLPADLAARTSSVSAVSEADVRLVVDGAQVMWGTARDGEAKAAVLRELMARYPASVYDVSAPGAPATRP